jgi:hypothetical protein
MLRADRQRERDGLLSHGAKDRRAIHDSDCCINSDADTRAAYGIAGFQRRVSVPRTRVRATRNAEHWATMTQIIADARSPCCSATRALEQYMRAPPPRHTRFFLAQVEVHTIQKCAPEHVPHDIARRCGMALALKRTAGGHSIALGGRQHQI